MSTARYQPSIAMSLTRSNLQGAWCIISSPLVLGYDVTNTSITERVWPIISNRKAVEVNQQYAGHPGRLIKAWNVTSLPPPPTDVGFLVAGNCTMEPSTTGWSYDAASGHLIHNGLCVNSNTDPSELQVSTCNDKSPNRE